jgi:hypothetical protein
MVVLANTILAKIASVKLVFKKVKAAFRPPLTPKNP